MDYQYISTVHSGAYMTLDTTIPFPGEVGQEIQKYTTITDASSSLAAGRKNYSMFSLTSGATPILVFSQTALRLHSTSVCYNTQCLGWLLSGEKAKKMHSEILETPFLTEQEVASRAHGEIAINGTDLPEILEVPVHRNAIRAILYASFKRWARGGEPIRIKVPADVDYNGYVFGALRTIYSYFPLRLRVETGFSSYLDNTPATGLNRLTLLFAPESANKEKMMALDGSTPAVYHAFLSTTGYAGLDELIEHLACLDDPQERADFVERIYHSLEEENFLAMKPGKYAIFGDYLNILDESKSLSERLPRLRNFCLTQGDYPDTLRQTIKDTIVASLTEETVTSYAEKLLESGTEKTVEFFEPLSANFPDLPNLLWPLFRAHLTGDCRTQYQAVSGNRGLWNRAAGEENIDQFLREKAREVVESLITGQKHHLDILAQKEKLALSAYQAVETVAKREIAKFPEAESNWQEELHMYAYALAEQMAAKKTCLSYVPEETHPNAVRANLKELQALKQELDSWDCPPTDLTRLIAEKVEAHHQCLDSANSRLTEVMVRLGAVEYFGKLDIWEMEYAAFSPETRHKIRESIVLFPTDLKKYGEKFQHHYGVPLTLTNLPCGDHAKQIILEDVKKLLNHDFAMGENIPQVQLEQCRAVNQLLGLSVNWEKLGEACPHLPPEKKKHSFLVPFLITTATTALLAAALALVLLRQKPVELPLTTETTSVVQTTAPEDMATPTETVEPTTLETITPEETTSKETIPETTVLEVTEEGLTLG